MDSIFKIGDKVRIIEGIHRGHTGVLINKHRSLLNCFQIDWDLCTRPAPVLCEWYFTRHLAHDTKATELLYA